MKTNQRSLWRGNEKLRHAGFMIPTNPDLLGKSVGVTGVACSVLLGITVILLVLNVATAKTLPWHKQTNCPVAV